MRDNMHDAKTQRLLIVDDKAENIQILMELLKDRYKISAATSGGKALELIENGLQPDLILLDVIMPAMDGFQVISKLKGSDETSSIPVIFVTGLNDTDVERKGLDMGAIDFISKPFSPELVKARIRNHLELKQIRDGLEDIVAARTGELSIINQKLQSEIEDKEKAYDQLKSAQTALVSQEKLASIGQLSSGIAHELNNPLGFITSNFYVLKHYFDSIQGFIEEACGLIESSDSLDALVEKYNIDSVTEEIKAIFDESAEGFTRISCIVDNLLAFARTDNGKLSLLNINAAIKSTLAVARNELKYVAEVTEDFGDIPDSEFNAGEVNQVFLNILLNAAYAVKSQQRQTPGHINIKTWNDDKWIYISIEDDGPGVPENIQEKIFDIFFTTKPMGEGTGLGLNIVHDIIVSRHKGDIKLTSEPGRTCFTITLPICRSR